MITKLSKLILNCRPTVIVIPYCCLIIGISIVISYCKLPDSIFSDDYDFLKAHIFDNSIYYFTCTLLPFVFCIHHNLSYGHVTATIVPVLRIVVTALTVKTLQSESYILSHVLGSCSNSQFDGQMECQSRGYTWVPLSVSVHLFYATNFILVILEEASYYKLWEQLDNESKENNSTIEDASSDDSQLRSQYSIQLCLRFSIFIKINYFVIAAVSVMLHVDAFFAVLYFPTMIGKVIGAIAGAILWSITFHVIFSLYKPEDYFAMVNSLSTS